MNLDTVSDLEMTGQDEEKKEDEVIFKKALAFLKSSLIFDMSLGSKELFHSNVWGFLMKNDHNFIKIFYPLFDSNDFYDDKIEIEREWHHRDLAIQLPKKDGTKSLIVIENKIKSTPYFQQLEDYTKSYKDCIFERGILTGIDEKCALDFSSSEKLKGRWDYIDYKTISKGIRDIATKSTKQNIINNLPTIEEYCDVLEAIDTCLKYYLSKSKGVLKYDCGELGELRIADVYKKMKGSDFLNFVKKEKPFFDKICPKGFETVISQSFHNGKATLDVRFLKQDDKICSVIGVQLEGDQFRVCVQCGKYDHEWTSKKEIYSNILYDRFKDIWFDDSFDKKIANRTIFNHRFKTSLSPRGDKKFDVYMTDYYCFIYQYFDINDQNDYYDKLLNLIKEFMSEAASVLQIKFNSQGNIE